MGKRIERLFKLIQEKNLSCSEIQKRLNPDLIAREREKQSVNNVKNAIYQIDFIKDIEETARHSFDDIENKYDLIAYLSGRSIDFIGIQVKSSYERIEKFYEKLSQNGNLQQILIDKKLVVINGQQPLYTIQNIFLKQFEKINKFYEDLSHK